MERALNSKDWYESNQSCAKICANYTKVSSGGDHNGDLFVILERNNTNRIDLLFVKLTENKAFWGTNTDSFDKELGSGYWVKTNGN